jgi:hypothetical protein
MVALFNNSQDLEDFRTICSLVGNKTPVSTYTHRQFFICGLTTEQEELFARSWEQYMKDGVAPSREYIKLFKNFRLNIVMDGHHRDERKKFENYEDLSDSFITPAKKKFFGELLVGKKTQVNWLREIMFFCLYTCSLVALLTFISSPLSSILLNKIAEFLRN